MSAAHAVKAPPRKSTPRASKVAATPAEPDKTLTQRRTEGLNGLAQLGQLLCVGTGQLADAAAIGMHFPPLAKATADLAEDHEGLGKTLDYLIQFGPYTALVAAAAPLVLQLLANHKVVDAGSLASQGVVSPDVLESRMRADIAQMQAQAKMEEMQALREAQAQIEQYNAMVAEENGKAA